MVAKPQHVGSTAMRLFNSPHFVAALAASLLAAMLSIGAIVLAARSLSLI